MGPDDDVVSVLVVEDESELLEFYAECLQSDFDVETAGSGTEALARFSRSIDVVLLDRQMPGLSGDEVLAELRSRGHDVPVAMVTGVEPDVDIVDLPFDEYLKKPIDCETMVQTTELLAQRASFEAKSRAFFRILSKKSTLDAETAVDHETSAEYDVVIDRMQELQSELDATLKTAIADSAPPLSLDTADVESLLKEIYDHPLPNELAALIEAYQELQDARPPFMWKWVHRLAPQNTLPCVSEHHTGELPVDKTIAILVVTLFDDLLELRQDRRTFNELRKIPLENQEADPTNPNVDGKYVSVTQHVWDTLQERIQRAPNYEEYEALFRYDFKQTIASVEYSDLAISRPELATMGDLERYESHNMAMFVYADIDLMHSPIEVRTELPTLRKTIWTAQLMARIGNWVSTWEREFREGDYSSGVVVSALEEGVISREEIANLHDDGDRKERFIERIKESGIEEDLLRRWQLNYHRLRKYDRDLAEIDLGPFIDGTEEVLRYHLSSTGLK